MKHKEFRANLWTSLFSYSAQVSFEQKLPKFYPPTTTPIPYTFQTESLINIESYSSANQQAEIIEHKWKILGKRVYCYNCRALYLATKKRKFGDKICINGIQRKRAGQTL
jgi:hypothetical protein